jgi:hypothetical protein
MRHPRVVTLLIALAASAAAVPAMAHHSGAMFEEKKEVTLNGVVLVDVKGADGKVTTWGFEAEGPSSMTRAGIRLKDFTPGTNVTITGRPMKDGRPAALWVKATRTSDNRVFVPGKGFAVR